MEDRIIAIIDYNNYRNYLSNIYSSNYKSTSVSLLSFDRVLKDKFLSAFCSANSTIRRDLISGLKRMRFDDERVSHIEEIKQSKIMLNELIDDLQSLKNNNTDSIAEFVISESIAVLKEIVDKINVER